MTTLICSSVIFINNVSKRHSSEVKTSTFFHSFPQQQVPEQYLHEDGYWWHLHEDGCWHQGTKSTLHCQRTQWRSTAHLSLPNNMHPCLPMVTKLYTKEDFSKIFCKIVLEYILQVCLRSINIFWTDWGHQPNNLYHTIWITPPRSLRRSFTSSPSSRRTVPKSSQTQFYLHFYLMEL